MLNMRIRIIPHTFPVKKVAPKFIVEFDFGDSLGEVQSTNKMTSAGDPMAFTDTDANPWHHKKLTKQQPVERMEK